MQDIAKEMNLSETAFLYARDAGYNLRWFTPMVEVDLCGHATLASAHALWEKGVVPENQSIKFHTKSGELGATKKGELIELDFPATAPQECSAPEGLESALGITAQWVGKNVVDYFTKTAIGFSYGAIIVYDTKVIQSGLANENRTCGTVNQVSIVCDEWGSAKG